MEKISVKKPFTVLVGGVEPSEQLQPNEAQDGRAGRAAGRLQRGAVAADRQIVPPEKPARGVFAGLADERGAHPQTGEGGDGVERGAADGLGKGASGLFEFRDQPALFRPGYLVHAALFPADTGCQQRVVQPDEDVDHRAAQSGDFHGVGSHVPRVFNNGSFRV